MESSDPSAIYGALANFDVDEKKIGQGQFSVVHRAICKADGRQVALKKVQVSESQECSLITLQLFEMMDSKARQDCLKEIELLKVNN